MVKHDIIINYIFWVELIIDAHASKLTCNQCTCILYGSIFWVELLKRSIRCTKFTRNQAAAWPRQPVTWPWHVRKHLEWLKANYSSDHDTIALHCTQTLPPAHSPLQH